LLLAGQLEDLLHVGFRRQAQFFLGQLEAVGAHRHLGQGFLAGDVEALFPVRQPAQHL